MTGRRETEVDAELMAPSVVSEVDLRCVLLAPASAHHPIME